MDTTLRYVQQFGRSKRDNLRPSLTSKYHVGQVIEVTPFRIMDFGCFASTDDGLSGLLHNSEMTSELQNNLQEMVEQEKSIRVKINKFDRRTGEIAFVLADKPESEAKTETPSVPVVEAQGTAASQAVDAAQPETTPVPADAGAKKNVELEPHQFTTPQPVVYKKEKEAELQPSIQHLQREMADIEKFLEGVLKTKLSPKAKEMLEDLLKKNSVFRFTYAMQTCVDHFEPDVGVQLLTSIERMIEQQKNS
jgi:predicted RNA-binding protein with RPS1 domain